MTLQEIETRATNEAKVFAVAKQIRELLDKAAQEIELPDDRDVEEEIVSLVTED